MLALSFSSGADHLHLCSAAMEGFDSVIFAYGQTASGKTFTLVRRLASRYAAPC